MSELPREYISVLSTEKLQATITQLDSATAEILAAGQANENAYQNKADLMKRSRELDTEIQLAEAEAIMAIEGEARSQYVMVGDKKIALANDQARDAYRRTASKAQRQELAQVTSKISKIDVEIAKAKEKYNATQESSQNIRAKANLQAALLNFLR